PVSNGMTDDFDPSFDPDGKYLYFVSRRTLHPDFGAFELNFQFSATDKVYAVTLRPDLESPVKPESDEEGGPDSSDDAEENGGAGKDDKAKDTAAKNAPPMS